MGWAGGCSHFVERSVFGVVVHGGLVWFGEKTRPYLFFWLVSEGTAAPVQNTQNIQAIRKNRPKKKTQKQKAEALSPTPQPPQHSIFRTTHKLDTNWLVIPSRILIFASLRWFFVVYFLLLFFFVSHLVVGRAATPIPHPDVNPCEAAFSSFSPNPAPGHELEFPLRLAFAFAFAFAFSSEQIGNDPLGNAVDPADSVEGGEFEGSGGKGAEVRRREERIGGGEEGGDAAEEEGVF